MSNPASEAAALLAGDLEAKREAAERAMWELRRSAEYCCGGHVTVMSQGVDGLEYRQVPADGLRELLTLAAPAVMRPAIERPVAEMYAAARLLQSIARRLEAEAESDERA